MDDRKKRRIKFIAGMSFIILMVVILCIMFKDSYKDIFYQLSHTDIVLLGKIIFIGSMYYFLDALVYRIFFRREGYTIGMGSCVILSYLSIFFNVTTFGAGNKPAQVFYLRKKGVDPGSTLGITALTYTFHKLIIVIYALVMLAFNYDFVKRNFHSSFKYIKLGVMLSVLIIVFLVLLCASKTFHKLVFKLLHKFFKKEKAIKAIDKFEKQTVIMRRCSLNIIKNPKDWIFLCFINAIKMSCWYVIPLLAIPAAGGSLDGVTFFEMLTVTSLMQLIMGVIPTSGGVGSLEVVFSLIFAAIFGKVTAGTCMVLYRIATYYFPFVVSIGTTAMTGYDKRKKDEIHIDIE